MKVISDRGRNACREKAAALSPEISNQDRQTAYRSCLSNIDQELVDQDMAIREQEARESATKRTQAEAEATSWASGEERLAYCRVNQDSIIQAEKDRIRALGPSVIAQEKNANLTVSERQSRIERYEDTVRELEALIPPRMRAGLPLIPDAIKAFTACDPDFFSNPNQSQVP